MTEETRLSRWSRMKTKTRPKGRGIFFKAPPADFVEAETETAPADVASLDRFEPDDLTERDAPVEETTASEAIDPDAEAEEPYPEDLPPLDSLTKDSDFTGFMSARVSDKIRNAALRKLWISNPALANLDGLLDYGEDLTSSFKSMEGMKTAYVVGRGMVDFEAEARLAAQKALEKEEAEALAKAENAETSENVDAEGSESTEDTANADPDDESQAEAELEAESAAKTAPEPGSEPIKSETELEIEDAPLVVDIRDGTRVPKA